MHEVVANEPDKNRNCIINCTWNISIIFFPAKWNSTLAAYVLPNLLPFSAVRWWTNGWKTTWMDCCIILISLFFLSQFLCSWVSGGDMIGIKTSRTFQHKHKTKEELMHCLSRDFFREFAEKAKICCVCIFFLGEF